MSCQKVQRCFQLTSLGKWLNNNATLGIVNFEGIMHSIKHCDVRHVMTWHKITGKSLFITIFFSIRIFWMMKWHSSDVCIKTKAFNYYGIFLCVCHNKLVWRTVAAMVTYDGRVAMVTFDGTLLSPQQNTLNTLGYQVYINTWRWVIIVFKPAYTLFYTSTI